jgi:prephenate dehydrogenase
MSDHYLFRRVALIGCGFLGSSLCLDLRQREIAHYISGYNEPFEFAQSAQAMGIVNVAQSSLQEAVRDADLVILATPVVAMSELMESMAGYLSPNCTVMDLGSVKQAVVQASVQLGDLRRRFVPCHPMAGGHQSGCKHAKVGLFAKQTVWLTPVDDTEPQALHVIEQMWKLLDAHVLVEAANIHDDVCAINSHLPHLLAFAYMNSWDQHCHKELIFQSAGAGFRDFTRIAASNPNLWDSVLKSNQSAIRQALNALKESLNHIEEAMNQAIDHPALLNAIFKSQASRNAWELMKINS